MTHPIIKLPQNFMDNPMALPIRNYGLQQFCQHAIVFGQMVSQNMLKRNLLLKIIYPPSCATTENKKTMKDADLMGHDTKHKQLQEHRDNAVTLFIRWEVFCG